VAEIALDHRPGSLPLAEAGDVGPAGEAVIGGFEGPLDALRFDFNLQDDLALGDSLGRNLHFTILLEYGL
jgi:hypothetical protein